MMPDDIDLVTFGATWLHGKRYGMMTSVAEKRACNWRVVASQSDGSFAGLPPEFEGGMDDDIPVIVRVRVECARRGHAEEEIYEFAMPVAKAQPRDSDELGRCPKCGAPVQMHLKTTQHMSYAAWFGSAPRI